MTQNYPQNREIGAHTQGGFGAGAGMGGDRSGGASPTGKTLPTGFSLPYGGARVNDPAQRAVLRVNQIVNNSGVLVDVPDLAFAVQANDVFSLEVHLIYQSNSTADFKWQITLPAGSAGIGWLISPALGTSVGTITVMPFGATSSAEGAGVSTGAFIWGSGQIYIGSSGLVTFSYAQNTPNVSDTTLVFGTYIKAERILYR